jgi:nicotinamidase-related amidase
MKTLIVIDMQNDFITGALGSSEAQAIVPNVKKKIEEYKARGDEIIFTRDTHGEDYLDTNEGRHLPVPHCIKGTHGWNLVEEICTDGYKCVKGCRIIDKHTFGNALWNHERTISDAYVRGEECNIELVGLCTDICVISNALILKATYPEANIMVDANCCAGVTPESHRAALTTMKSCQINVVGE